MSSQQVRNTAVVLLGSRGSEEAFIVRVVWKYMRTPRGSDQLLKIIATHNVMVGEMDAQRTMLDVLEVHQLIKAQTENVSRCILEFLFQGMAQELL